MLAITTPQRLEHSLKAVLLHEGGLLQSDYRSPLRVSYGVTHSASASFVSFIMHWISRSRHSLYIRIHPIICTETISGKMTGDGHHVPKQPTDAITPAIDDINNPL